MHSRSERVQSFFDKTQLYLHKDSDISIRTFVVNKLLGELNHSRILDLGCGDGRISLQYVASTNHITLIDLSDNMLKISRENTPEIFKKNVDYINIDIQQYENEENFDVVICIGVLAHVASIEETIAKVARFLKPGGRCIFQITNADNYLGKCLMTYHEVRNSIVHSREYTINKTHLSYINNLAHKNQLIFLDKRQYWSVFPGMGKLPNKWLWQYQIFTLKHGLLSRMGSEVILLYVKEL